MVNVLIRGVPDDLHAQLQQRAKQRGQSLQAYLMTELSSLVAKPSLADVLARIERRGGGELGSDRAVQFLDEERALRDRG